MQSTQRKTETFVLFLFFFRFTIKCRGSQLRIYSSWRIAKTGERSL